MNKNRKWAKKSFSNDEIIKVKFNPITGTRIVKNKEDNKKWKIRKLKY